VRHFFSAAAVKTNRLVCLSVGLFVTIVSPAKTIEPIEMPFRSWAGMGPTYHVLDGVQIPMGIGNLEWKGRPLWSIGNSCRELCINGWIDQFALWVVSSGGPKEAQVQSYSPGGASLPAREGTLAPRGEYDWTVRLMGQCGLMSNYFDHLLL